MNRRYLLGIALTAAVAVAACGDDPNSLGEDGNGDAPPRGGPGGSNGGAGGGAGGGAATPNAPGNETNSPAGQAFFVANVQPFMKSQCGSCHQDAVGGAPRFMNNTDAIASYKLLFQMGFVVTGSRIVLKTPHGGSTTNELSAAQKGTYNQWVAMELKDGGNKATPNVMEKLGGCLSEQLFNAIQMQNLRTTRRNNENANNCTGCDNAPCRTCHAQGEANFVAAQGTSTAILPANYTFNETKKSPFINRYFGVSPSGEPIASDALKAKSDATVTAKPYTHPMYTLNATQTAAIKAFVDDAVAKYKANTCAPTP